MKERPILFSAPMVRAILDDHKGQTRRIMKPQPHAGVRMSPFVSSGLEDGHGRELRCPHGKPGDRLWVRETFYAFGRWETRFSAKKGRDEWHFIDMTVPMDRLYQFADPTPESLRHRSSITPAWWKRPAIFMPRAAGRITLEITGVRAERLQDISYEDALAEGIYNPAKCPPFPHTTKETPEQYARRTGFPQRAYAHLWEEINGTGTWEANPWVWVVEFNRIDC